MNVRNSIEIVGPYLQQCSGWLRFLLAPVWQMMRSTAHSWSPNEGTTACSYLDDEIVLLKVGLLSTDKKLFWFLCVISRVELLFVNLTVCSNVSETCVTQ